jgi:hypothetical protein
MKLKLYETYNYETKKRYWWTQRDKNTNCFEIRQCDTTKKWLLFVNEILTKKFDTFNEAEREIKKMWVA